MNKKKLSIILSKLKDYNIKKPSLEQYTTPSSIAASLLWQAYMNNDIEDKTIIDLGCGNGILGIGALLLGAKKVLFVDLDDKAIKTTKLNCENLRLKNYELINSHISKVKKKADIVIMNPPFGVQTKNSDILFLKKSVKLGKKVYLIYKGDGLKIIKKTLPSHNARILEHRELIIKQQFSYHKKPKMRTKIILAIIN
jgi:putative methylase